MAPSLRTAAAWSIAVLTLSGGMPLNAQRRVDTTFVDGRPSCQTCSIELVRQTVVGASHDSVLLLPSSRALVSSNGRIWVTPVSSPGRIASFDSLGKLTAVFGKFGEGPGEASSPQQLAIGQNDSLYAFNTTARRMNVFDASGRYVRSIPVAVGSFELMLSVSGGIVVVGRSATSASFGLPVHRLDVGSGLVTQSFGRIAPVAGTPPPLDRWKQVAPAGQQVWVGERGRYIVELWNTDNTLAKVLRVRSTLFPDAPASGTGSSPFSERPVPRLLDLATLPNGMVATLLFVPPARWSPAPGWAGRAISVGESGVAGSPPLSEHNKYWNTVLEIIDPNTGRLLVSTRLTAAFTSFAGNGTITSVEQDSAGYVRLNIWKVVLRPVRQ